ncbi:MAG: peptidylprolyl isomerase [Spirochaetaceae bacterium]|nr:peptidylprolyl isomerase [Spirochaetaceae bacterium]
MKAGRERVISFNFLIRDSLGNELESSDGSPSSYIQGIGAALPAIEQALDGQEAGFKTELKLSAAEAFGDYNEDYIITVPLSEFESEDIAVGMEFTADEDSDEDLIWRISKITDSEVTLDANHPYAGKALNFFIELTEVREATAEEIEQGAVIN